MILGGKLSYSDNSTVPLILAKNASVSDLDSADFNGGRLIVRTMENVSELDRLSIRHQGDAAGRIGVSGNRVSYGGVPIGIVSGGSGDAPLVVVFDSEAATVAAVQALVRRIAFESAAEAPPS